MYKRQRLEQTPTRCGTGPAGDSGRCGVEPAERSRSRPKTGVCARLTFRSRRALCRPAQPGLEPGGALATEADRRGAAQSSARTEKAGHKTSEECQSPPSGPGCTPRPAKPLPSPPRTNFLTDVSWALVAAVPTATSAAAAKPPVPPSIRSGSFTSRYLGAVSIEPSSLIRPHPHGGSPRYISRERGEHWKTKKSYPGNYRAKRGSSHIVIFFVRNL